MPSQAVFKAHWKPAVQLDLFERSIWQQFDAWVHTPQGRSVADRFIRIAYGCHLRGARVGAKAIWERLRWHYEVAARRAPGERYRLNNIYTPYMARFAMDREPKLAGFFELRMVGRDKPDRRALVIPLRRKPITKPSQQAIECQ